MLYFCEAKICCANLIVLIATHLNYWYQNLYMIEYESNFITYCISQQMKRFSLSNPSRHLSKYTGNMILIHIKLVLNRMDLEKLLDMKNMRHVDTFPMVYHFHRLNIPLRNCGNIIWYPLLQNDTH
jgi:hypothetical protein